MTDADERDPDRDYQKEGDIAFKEGDIATAASLYKRAIERNPQDAWAEYSLAEVYKCQGDLARATHHYAQSLKLDPFGSSSFIQLLFTKVSAQQLNPIVDFYQQLSASKPENPWASVRLGDLLTKQGNVKDAIASYKAASYKLLHNNYPNYVSRHWDSRLSSEPAYIIIGPMKTATSALYEYINQHPKVLPSIKKEIHFFNDAEKLSYGKAWYRSHFPPIQPSSGYITGEASPGYIVNYVHDVVYDMFPNAKIIALVRDPVARAFSHYTHNCRHGFERRSFIDAVFTELALLQSLGPDDNIDTIAKKWNWNRAPGYVLLGLYVHFLRQWYSSFPAEQILVIHNSSLQSQPQETMKGVFSFLGIDQYVVPNYPRHNVGSYDSKVIAPNVKVALTKFFEPHQETLHRFLASKKQLFAP